jgi:hypothetical protein
LGRAEEESETIAYRKTTCLRIEKIWGVDLNVQSKTDILENQHRMLGKKLLKLAYDSELIGEMNCEKFEMSKAGQLLFSHRLARMMIGFGHLH